MRDLHVIADVYLPTWYLLEDEYTDTQVEEARQILLESYLHPKMKEQEPMPAIDISDLYQKLRVDGYNKDDSLEIVARVECGSTIDNAIQTVTCM